MSNQIPSPPDPSYLVLSRKLVLLFLLMVTTAMGLVALLMQARLSILVLALMLTDVVTGLVAGFSIRRIIPRKALVLRICSVAIFITGGLALLGWLTGLRYGIGLIGAGQTKLDWREISQILLALVSAFLALFAWQHKARPASSVTHAIAARKILHAPRKQKKPRYRIPEPIIASPDLNQTVQPASQAVATQPVKAKRKHDHHSRPKLVLSDQEEHRCPYCLELIDPDDRRGVVECKICHTLHHADCWAITGACQVPHFTA
jgi:hypothetical protein